MGFLANRPWAFPMPMQPQLSVDGLSTRLRELRRDWETFNSMQVKPVISNDYCLWQNRGTLTLVVAGFPKAQSTDTWVCFPCPVLSKFTKTLPSRRFKRKEVPESQLTPTGWKVAYKGGIANKQSGAMLDANEWEKIWEHIISL